MHRAVAPGCDVGQVDAGLHRAGELDLGLLGRLAQALHGHLVAREVDPVGVLELRHQPVDDALVPVVAAQVVVTGGRLDLDHTVADLQQGHVERATTEVEDEDPLLLVGLVQAVGQGRGRGLVDDARDVQARDLAGLLGGLPLGVVEVSRDRDHGVGDGLAEVGLRVALELAQHAGADLLGSEALVVHGHAVGGVAHVALDRSDGAVRVGDGLALGDLTDEDLAVLGEGDHGGGRPRTLGVGDHDGLARLEDGDAGVGGTEVDADSTTHLGWSFRSEARRGCRRAQVTPTMLARTSNACQVPTQVS